MCTNEFGETPRIYVWPQGHIEGDPFPDNFWEQLALAMEAYELDWEIV